MYWPFGTPRIYASSSSRTPSIKLLPSSDGLPSPSDVPNASPAESYTIPSRGAASEHDQVELAVPTTPLTPVTPAVAPVDYEEGGESHQDAASRDSKDIQATPIPIKDPVLALRTSRTGHLFATITTTLITVWQTKPTVVLAIVVRSESSLHLYGDNVDLFLRPDSAILVVRTANGYLITYSLATDGESRVYRPHFPNHHNVQRRRQGLVAGQQGLAPDDFVWGAGEGAGIRDISVRFRMVIKVDAGIESALALDDELVVATRKPAAVQCIRWSPDSSGSQTRTELISRMGWTEKKASIVEMTHDRPMNLYTWITSDGRAYAVQRHRPRQGAPEDDADAKKLFKGHCFHSPSDAASHAVKAVINARFSLIAVGCVDGSIQVYSVRDYEGNVPHSHTHRIPVSIAASGAFTNLTYSPDGYSLFAGFANGWSTWSMFGKLGTNSFSSEAQISQTNGEDWLQGVKAASWIGGGAEILLIGQQHEAVWSLEMAKSAVTGCYNDSNVFRTVLQTPTGIMVYRGYDLPDLTSISAEPFLWHSARIPATYLLRQWPIRQTVISPDGRYVAVAGKRGLAHYSVNSGRWKTFTSDAMENDFQVRGGMCWHQHVLVAAVESNKTYEMRLYSREAALDSAQVIHREALPAPAVLITTSGEDSLLVYTYENLLYHYIFVPHAGSVRLIQVGQIAFHGIVRSPARVRALSWVLPNTQLVDGDPSQDVAVASVLFLVDGKLVLLRPSLNDEGQLKYDMRVIAQNVEFFANMRDQPALNANQRMVGAAASPPSALKESLWVFDGVELKVWPQFSEVLEAASGEAHKDLPPCVSVPVDFYPLSILLEKGVVLGVESDLVQRRDVSFSFFHFAIRTHLLLPDILRFYLRENRIDEATALAQQYQHLEYFAHGLEMLLHRVLDEEADTSPSPDEAVLPRVLSLLSSFKEYLDVVLQCTRKTEVRQWKTLFAYLPPAQELFEESLQRGSLKTAGGYLIVLHTLDELDAATEQPVRLLTRAMSEGDWDLCKELARFLAAMDEKGEVLQEVMKMVNATTRQPQSDTIAGRLAIPSSKGLRNGSSPADSADEDGTQSSQRSGSDAGSVASTMSPIGGLS
ncbi:uncharacterized protein J7T54_006189 [Emericellopsis cladophorae]|uniref:RIC1 C-terminal alpha solenoid region domain-containing protein n=1 Tax=Emericellopsis cladophorae TaxID=2686198 RepID=A0A9P9YA25_9HYPO|nr:uncharacterized protein J7T54_006189 [Emericellopsis cladophorae]KAI6785850.1 hypothetical protein J7T54_006189 [Emericellopsis cladophorae]